jgi:hypothetical protein
MITDEEGLGLRGTAKPRRLYRIHHPVLKMTISVVFNGSKFFVEPNPARMSYL